MNEPITPMIVAVRFVKVGKLYHFDARNVPDLKVGDQVVVETSRGWQLGEVAQIFTNAISSDGVKMIDRRATPRDLVLRQSWQTQEAEVLKAGQKRAAELGLAGIKVILAEYSFDGSRLTISFSSESEEKFELKSLRQDMQRAFAPSQVELRQIGPRDVAKLMGGMGACGLEERCCSHFLCEFSSISIKMAKEQGISLTPTEITGMCGRLRCCLIYEYEQYTQARALLPKRNKRVMTPQGEARIIDQIPIRDAVYVQLLDDSRREFKRSEIQLMDENGAVIPNAKIEGMDQVSLAVESDAVEEVQSLPQMHQMPEQPGDSQNRPQGYQGRQQRPDNRPERSNRPKGQPQRGQDPVQQNPRPPIPGRGPQGQNRMRPGENRPGQPPRPDEKAGDAPRQPGNNLPQQRPPSNDRRGGPPQAGPGNRPGQGPRRRSGDRRGPGRNSGPNEDGSNKPDDEA